MRRILPWLAGWLITWAPPATSAQEAEGAHRDRIAELRAAEPGRRLEVVERLLGTAPQPSSLARGLYDATLAWSDEPNLAADVEQRLELLRAAELAASRFDEDAAAQAADTRARIFESLGLAERARDERARALASYPRAARARPILRLGLAESHRQLANYASALAELEVLEGEIEGDPRWSALKPVIEQVRCQAYIDFGMPDLASGPIRARWQAVRTAYANGELRATDALPALLAYVRLLKATGANAEVAEVGREFLERAGGLDGDPLELARLAILVGSSELRLESNDPAAAHRGAARLRAALNARLAPQEEIYARLALASASLAAGDPEEAAEHVARVRQRLETWRPAGAERRLTREAAQLAALEVRLALLRGAPENELRALAPRIEDALDTLLAHWDQVPRRAGGAGYLLYADRRAVLGESVRLGLALHGPEEGARIGLENVLRVQARGSLARRAPDVAPSVAAVRAALTPAGHGLLVYVSAKGSSHVFALDADELVHAELAGADTLDSLASEYLAHVSQDYGAGELDWASDIERDLARRLSAELLPEDVARLVAGWEALGVCGLDTLGWVPFEWLPLRNEAFLGSSHAVSYLVSIPFATARATDSASTPVATLALDVLLVGGAEHGAAVRARWPELAYVPIDDEVEAAICAGYPAERRDVLRGVAATPESLADRDLGGVGVLQFFAHSVLEPERERPTALVLSPGRGDGLLRCADVERLAGPRFVLLATCRSSAGPVRRGDPNAADLGGAWLAAGARAVLLSRKDVTVDAAKEISRVVHRALRAGASPAEALRRHRAELVAEAGERAPLRSHLLHVVGLGHEAPLEARAEPAPRGSAGEVPFGAGPLAHSRAARWGALLVGVGLLAALGVRSVRRAATARSPES